MLFHHPYGHLMITTKQMAQKKPVCTYNPHSPLTKYLLKMHTILPEAHGKKVSKRKKNLKKS
jgi:hypothetical protein